MELGRDKNLAACLDVVREPYGLRAPNEEAQPARVHGIPDQVDVRPIRQEKRACGCNFDRASTAAPLEFSSRSS